MTRIALLLLALVYGAPAHAPDWKSALGRPISSGSVALLVEHKAEPAVRERWSEALRDARPEVRAAAARVIHTSGAEWLVPDLVTALAKEEDVGAAIEELRAIGSLGNASTDGALLAAARRLGPPVVDVAADALGRMRGADALVHLASLRSSGLTSAGYSHLTRMAARNGNGGVTQVAQAAVRESDAQAWRAALTQTREAGHSVDGALLKAALALEDPRFRTLTYWHLLGRVDGGEVTPPDVAAVVASTPEASGREPGDADAQFAFEMLQRAQGRAAREVGSWITERRQGRTTLPYGFAYDDVVLKRLTTAERKALQLPDVKDLKPRPRRAPREDADPVLTMTTAFPAGFAADVIASAGCKPDAWHIAAALIRYGPEGRPRNTALIESHLSPSCADASRTLLLSTLAPPGATAASSVVVVPLSLDVLTCGADEAGARRPAAGGALRIGGPIQEPRKTVHVAPIYPEAAKQARVAGTVILEAVISPLGCVREMKVLEGVPQLNAAAISAVARWRYTPTLLDGRPVPVIMTVTINFRLGP